MASFAYVVNIIVAAEADQYDSIIYKHVEAPAIFNLNRDSFTLAWNEDQHVYIARTTEHAWSRHIRIMNSTHKCTHAHGSLSYAPGQINFNWLEAYIWWQ